MWFRVVSHVTMMICLKFRNYFEQSKTFKQNYWSMAVVKVIITDFSEYQVPAFPKP